MTRVLSVAEKPSVAKKLAQILSRPGHPTTRNSPSPYNKNFEFRMRLEGQMVDMVITSVTGHLMEIDFDASLRGWTSCTPAHLFEAPVQKRVPDDKKDIERNLLQQARRCQKLILWLDCDREGENIAFEVIDVCRRANPAIQIRRAQFSSLIPADIHRACCNLRAPNENHSIAVDTRQEIDLRLGAVFTRWQTMHLQKKFDEIGGVVSYGPCQFPTLGFVVERFLKREKFVSEPYWRIKVTHKGAEDGPVAVFNWHRQRLFCQLTTLVFYEDMVKEPVAKVVSVQGREVKKFRPLPLATVEFQKCASRYLRMESKKAMDIAEKLYQKGILSYPRTETNIFKKEFDLRSMVQTQTQSPEFGQYAAQLLNHDGFQWPRNGKDDDGAHPPIHPKTFDPSLQGDEKRVFDFVARHFLACCSKDAIGYETTTRIEIRCESFVTKGLMVLARNWLDVYPFVKWNVRHIPIYREGQTFQPTSVSIEEGKTEPPNLLTEADLIQLMNVNGIGTDATIAEHIAKVKDRDYVRVENRFFVPSKLGIALVQGYKNMEIAMASPYLRQKIESDISDIAEGKKTQAEVLTDCLNHMKEVYQTIMESSARLDDELSTHFSSLGEGKDYTTIRREFSRCGCGSMMAQRKSGEKRLLKCHSCSQVCLLPRGNIRSFDFHCPLCNFQILEIENSKTKKSHKICPHCFNNPPAKDIEDMGSNDGRGFRCFQCSETKCEMATKRVETPVLPCSQCSGVMVLKLTKNKRYMLGCNNHPACSCAKFISGAKSVEVLPTPCRRCSQPSRPARQLRFQFKREAGIPPMLSSTPDFIACIGCSPDLCDVVRSSSKPHSTARGHSLRKRKGTYPRLDLNNGGDRKPLSVSHGNTPINGPMISHGNSRFNSRRKKPKMQNKSRRQNKRQQNRNGGSGNDSIICYACKQPGHYASSCP
eukprot:CAMPEP_0114491312 /NCGR_PEP_ID=MMETSP0109-20121206/2931_1 /TAXON_ID=29199 /ORGANISM="Chlorarachnion reptans, Strain CCCM449" /LENGTH=930 /DNA_ID=CAMNT_0001668033 /DNA_START=287 /DNA_END=3075 /DNA_ORIENTATION=-